MAEFLDIPPEVVNIILSHCTKSAVLQLRMVCKWTRAIVAKSQSYKDLFKDIWINLDSGMLLGKFMEEVEDFPIQNVSIDMDEPTSPLTPHLFKDPELLEQFMDRFSPSIRNLRVTHMYCCTVLGEVKFYHSLSKLEALEIQTLQPLTAAMASSRGFQVDPRTYLIPPLRGQSLKRLEVRIDNGSGNFLPRWIWLCGSHRSLEVVAVPRELHATIHIGASEFPGAEAGRVGSLAVYPYLLRYGARLYLPNLKVLDLNGVQIQLALCNLDDKVLFHFLVGRRREGRNEFRLKNVSAEMLEEVRRASVSPEWGMGLLEDFAGKVLSTSGVHQMLKDDIVGFDMLEEVTFDTRNDVPMPLAEWNFGRGRMTGLPRLKRIGAKVGGVRTAQGQEFVNKLFLPEAPRETVTDLEVHFEGRRRGGMVITPAYLDAGFPNLTRVVLYLGGFRRREARVEVMEVLSRKTLLEDLSLESPRGIPEEAFFGTIREGETPVLLRLTNLRRLSLDSGSEVEVMGDRSLGLFARTSLSHLSIKGRGWEKVTNEGVVGLVGEGCGLRESLRSVDLESLESDVEGRSAELAEVEALVQQNKVRWTLNSD